MYVLEKNGEIWLIISEASPTIEAVLSKQEIVDSLNSLQDEIELEKKTVSDQSDMLEKARFGLNAIARMDSSLGDESPLIAIEALKQMDDILDV